MPESTTDPIWPRCPRCGMDLRMCRCPGVAAETTRRAALWRENEFGDPDQALYIGGLYVGGIMFLRHISKWRAWFMNDPEGNEVGRFDSAAEARFCVEGALLKALPEQLSMIVEAGMAT